MFGFHADGDGCICTFGRLTGLMETLVTEKVTDEELQNSLLATVENAEKSVDRENIGAAVNKFEVLKKQTNARRINKISNKAAGFVIDYAENMITQLLSQPPSGEAC